MQANLELCSARKKSAQNPQTLQKYLILYMMITQGNQQTSQPSQTDRHTE